MKELGLRLETVKIYVKILLFSELKKVALKMTMNQLWWLYEIAYSSGSKKATYEFNLLCDDQFCGFWGKFTRK